MPDDRPKRFPQRFQVGNASISAIGLERLGRFLIGAMLFGGLLAYLNRGFLESHAGFALMFGLVYFALCAVGAYFKIKSYS
jgi:hypothetical protein